MRRKFNAIRKIALCFLVWAIIGQMIFITPVWADGKVSSSESFSGDGVANIDGKAFLKLLPPGQGKFELRYQIKNEDNISISRIRIQETLQDKNGNVLSGPEAIIDESGILTGQNRTYSGKSYPIGGEGTAYSILYSLWYQKEGSNEWIVIKQNEKKSIQTISTDIRTTYQAQYSGKPVAGQEVLYMAEIRSNANVRLENIEVQDSVFGLLGTIAVLNPGERVVVSRAFKVNQTTESYITISFNDPVTGERIVRPMNSAGARVEIAQQEPVYSLEVSGNVDKNHINSKQDVKFEFRLKNSGNVELTDIKAVDWNGTEFWSANQLLPGDEESIQYTAEVSPGGSYEVVFGGKAPNGRKVEASYKVEFPKVEPKLEISCQITPREIEPGDTVTFKYVLKNTGDISLADIRVEEPQFGEVAKIDKLDPGEEKKFSIEKELGYDSASHPHVYAKDKETGVDYEFIGELQEIVVKVEAGAPHLKVSLSADPSTLTKKGSVELTCTIVNDGGIKINNIQVVLKERDMNMGSILVLEPGEEKTLTLSGIGVDENESFTAVVKGRTENGENVEFMSSPCQVTIKEEVSSEEKEEDKDNPSDTDKGKKTGEGSSKLSFLKNLLVIIVVLILLTTAGLVYMIKDLGKGRKKTGKHSKSRSRH